MKPTTKIMWIEKKSGEDGLSGPARIGRVSFSKSGKSIKYNGKTFQSFKGTGFKPNFYEVSSGDLYWISGCRKDGNDAFYTTDVKLDEDVFREYWVGIRNQPQNVDIESFRAGGKY